MSTTETHDARTAPHGAARPGQHGRGTELILHESGRFSGDEAPWSSEWDEAQLSSETVARIARMELAMGATLSLLRRCIVERMTPTREDLAAEAAFVFGTSREAAMAELDEVAQMVGVSSIR